MSEGTEVAKPVEIDVEAPEAPDADAADTSEESETPETDAAEEEAAEEESSRSKVEEALPDIPLGRRIEALVFASDRPLTEARIANVIGLAGEGRSARVKDAIAELNAQYDKGGFAFRLERVAGGWQVLTRLEYGPLLVRALSERQQSRLSPAALETLAIVAYRQPILRAEIEAIRGVACGEVLRSLMERRLVRIAGRAEELGRPMLYGTTNEFLKVFGLSCVEDLPEVEGLRR